MVNWFRQRAAAAAWTRASGGMSAIESQRGWRAVWGRGGGGGGPSPRSRAHSAPPNGTGVDDGPVEMIHLFNGVWVTHRETTCDTENSHGLLEVWRTEFLALSILNAVKYDPRIILQMNQITCWDVINLFETINLYFFGVNICTSHQTNVQLFWFWKHIIHFFYFYVLYIFIYF